MGLRDLPNILTSFWNLNHLANGSTSVLIQSPPQYAACLYVMNRVAGWPTWLEFTLCEQGPPRLKAAPVRSSSSLKPNSGGPFKILKDNGTVAAIVF